MPGFERGIIMPSLDEVVNAEQTAPIETPMDTMEVQEQPSRMNDFFQKILTAETGEGAIEDYLEHPMNFLNSKGLAQMLRGAHGILGNLKLAIIDIGFGFLRFSNERKAIKNVNSIPDGGNYPS